MKSKNAARVFFGCLLLLLSVASCSVTAQTTGYRTNVLASDQPGARHTSPSLLNPWGIAFLPGGDFFVAENASGRVDSYDVSGAVGIGVAIPAPLGSTAACSHPTGIAAVPTSDVGPSGSQFEFLVAADNGTIWGFNTADPAPIVARTFVDKSSTAANYTGIVFVQPDCCSPYIAVANFGEGNVDTFTRRGDPLSLAPFTTNPFIDPNLPAGFAPFNIQVIGNQIFVAYALQPSDHKPSLDGSGGGLVDVYDTVGNFVKRFVPPGGVLNAPWGITQASANFGAFSNDILIANDGGDGSISAFNPDTGAFIGQLTNTQGSFLFFVGLHGLAFRSDGVGDANALYDVDAAPESATPRGSFGTITDNNASFITLNFALDSFGNGVAAFVLPGDPVTLPTDIAVPAGSQSAAPTGTVVFIDTCCTLLSPTVTRTTLGTANVVDGTASIRTAFPGGNHVITANYSGDTNFGPGSTSAGLGVLLASRITLLTPSTVVLGTPVQLSVNVDSNPPVQPTSISGQVTFFDGTVSLGTVAVGAGAAHLTINSFSTGAHSIVARYSGSSFFQGSSSAAAIVTVANPVPAISSLAPFSGKQNSGAFTLTVHGSGFVNGAVVTFNGTPRPTAFESATVLTVSITASDLAAAGTATIAASNPAPGGGNSGVAMFAIDTATATSVTLATTTLTVTAGQSVTVKAQSTGFTGAVTVACLNAPAGVTCAFDQPSNTVTIQTSAATPKGPQAITLVFSAQALARNLSTTSFAMFLGLLGLPLGTVVIEVRRRSIKARYWIFPIVLLAALAMFGCGGGSSSPATQSTPPQTQSGQASAALTLTVQ